MPFIGKQSTSNSQITNYTTTVGSGGQTNFTVVIEGGDETHVYLNGVLLKETTDYTVSSTQVSLVSPAVENDIVEIKVFRSFALVDAVRATGGTFSGNVAYTGNIQVDDIVEKTSAHGVEIDGVTLKDGGGTFTGDVQVTSDASNSGFEVIHSNGTGGVSVGYNSITRGGTDTNMDLKIDGKGTGDVILQSTATGNVGIGTDSPSNIIHAVADNTSYVVQFEQDNVGGSGIYINSAGTNTNNWILYGASGVSGGIFGVKNDGNVGIGTSSPTGGKLEIHNDNGSKPGIRIKDTDTSPTFSNRFIRFSKSDGAEIGYIAAQGASVAYVTSSDYRLKENVSPITDAIDRLNALKPSRFNFITDPEKTLDGFLAHEVSDIVPEAVNGQKDAMTTEEFIETEAIFDEEGNEITPAIIGTREVIDPQGIDQSKLVPLLVASVQELSAKVTALENATN